MIFIENRKKLTEHNEQDTMDSFVRVAFQDGGTGGGNQKQRYIDSKTGGSAFYSDQKKKRIGESSSEDYNERGKSVAMP
jgi:hypothetical protein